MSEANELVLPDYMSKTPREIVYSYGISAPSTLNKQSLWNTLHTVDGGKIFLYRLEECISSTDFQLRIWNRLMGAPEHTMDVMENSFVLISWGDVAEAMAEHLVLSYLHNFHRHEFKQWRKSRKPRVLSSIWTYLKIVLCKLAELETLSVIYHWGMMITSVSLNTYSKSILFIVKFIWNHLYTLGTIIL